MTLESDIGTVLQILEIVSILGGGGLVAFKLGKTTQRVEQTLLTQNQILEGQEAEVTDLKYEVKKLGSVMTTIAVQNERINRIEADMRELKHGQGFVEAPRRR